MAQSESDPREALARAHDARLDRLRGSGERFRVASDALLVVRALSEGDIRLVAIDSLAAASFDLVQRLSNLPSHSTDFGQVLDRLEARLEAIEMKLLEIDNSLQMSQIKPRTENAPLPLEAMIRYCRLLAQYLAGSPPDRSDHLEYIATRILSVKSPQGRVMRHRNDVDPVLQYLACDVRPPAHVRTAAVDFLRSALRRVGMVERTEEFFDSDLYFDVRGYKVSLRESLLDPDILYAAAEVNVSTGNRLARLLASGAATRTQVEKKLDEANQRIGQIFTSEGTPDVEAKFEQARKTAPKAEPRTPVGMARLLQEREEVALKRRRALYSIASLVVLAALIGVAIYTRPAPSKSLTTIAKPELARISEQLENGAVSPGPTQPVFIGHVSIASWRALDAVARRVEAEQIRDRLLQIHGVTSALILRERTPVIQIEESRLVQVE